MTSSLLGQVTLESSLRTPFRYSNKAFTGKFYHIIAFSATIGVVICMMNYYIQAGPQVFLTFGPEGEEAIFNGRRGQKKGRIRGQTNCQIQERGFGFRSFAGSQGTRSL